MPSFFLRPWAEVFFFTLLGLRWDTSVVLLWMQRHTDRECSMCAGCPLVCSTCWTVGLCDCTTHCAVVQLAMQWSHRWQSISIQYPALLYSLYYRHFCTVVLSLQYFIALSQSTLQCKVDTVLSNWPLQYVQFILQMLLHSSSLQYSACRGVLFPHWPLPWPMHCNVLYSTGEYFTV